MLASNHDLLTPKEAAQRRRRSVRTLERERAEGRGPAYILDGGNVFYRICDIDAYLTANLRGGTETQPRRRGRPRKQPDQTTATA
jgi:hypothetical protein